ncbi:hypothetical protein NQD34_000693 [Periophthalmus magnuspinnatus]|nr:hypothetical protein NQD34_000693 [Periophthalmus magnuspinnatus]
MSHNRREMPQREGVLPYPIHHRPPSPMERGRRVVEESHSLLGPPPGKLRRIEGPGLSRELPPHSHVSHQPALQRVVSPSDRPLSVTVSRESTREERERGHRPFMDLKIQVNPTRRIKLNREVTRRGSADALPSGPEKSTFSSVPPSGDRHSPEPSLRREASPSVERRPGYGSAGDMGSERGRDRGPGLERDRDRGYVRDRSRQRVTQREAEEPRPTRSEYKSDQKIDQKNSGGGRSVSLDKMTIAEKLAKRQSDHQDKPNAVHKDREHKSDRSVSKDRTDRTVSSGEKPAAAQREAKDSQEPPAKTRPRISRKVLTLHSGTSSRSLQESKRNTDRQQKHTSSKPVEQQPSEEQQEHSISASPTSSPSQVEKPLIQPPPRSKWEDDEESQDNEPNTPLEPSPESQRSTEREAQLKAPKPAKAKDDKKSRPKKEEGKGLKNTEKTAKSKVVREEAKGAKDEARVVREESAVENKRGGSEPRAPEPRRQRLCSDLARETDEAAFVPDYSEGEGSEAERGRSCSPSQSLSQPSRSPSPNNNEDITGGDKKKKKHKKQKKRKKHKEKEKERKRTRSTSTNTRRRNVRRARTRK